VQGEGGFRANTIDYLKALRTIADEFGLLLVFDEVQCGMGRTGKLFAHEWSGVTPDVMALAKGLGGGFPVAATLATERAAIGLTAGTHGSTFGGNPLAMTVANAVLDVMLEENFLPRVRALGEKLRPRLDALVAKHPKIFNEVRGFGLMQGLRCVVPNAEVQTRLRDKGLLTTTAGDNVVRLLPPLIIEEPELDFALGCLDEVAAGWTS
jgi:acetylornithine/N-succinyldiaminopimelate aminotransferase